MTVNVTMLMVDILKKKNSVFVCVGKLEHTERILGKAWLELELWQLFVLLRIRCLCVCRVANVCPGLIQGRTPRCDSVKQNTAIRLISREIMKMITNTLVAETSCV